MQDSAKSMYDIGDLKNDPVQLYDLAVRFSQFFETRSEHQSAEIWSVLEGVSRSLWGNLPPVLVIDFRDPDDPLTWGKCGSPPMISRAAQSDSLPDLYSVAEVAKYFGVSKSTVCRWVKAGLLPCVRFGGRIYVEHGELSSAIAKGVCPALSVMGTAKQ